MTEPDEQEERLLCDSCLYFGAKCCHAGVRATEKLEPGEECIGYKHDGQIDGDGEERGDS